MQLYIYKKRDVVHLWDCKNNRKTVSHHYGGEVLTLKAADSLIQRFVHGC